jgi:hypothetical protein
MFGFQHKKEVVGVLNCFLSFFKNMKKKVPYMLTLMLDPRFKTFCIMFSLIGREQRKIIIEKYDKKIFISYFFKCHYYLHPLAEFERDVVDKKVEKDNSLNIFEMTTNTIEPTMKLMNRELLIFKHYQMDVKDIKCPL